MTVVFRPANLDPVALTEPEVFDNGERILAALIHTEHLPKGFPTELFAPQLVNGRFAIRVHIAVAPGKLLLSPRHQRGQQDPGQQPLSYVLFAQLGLALSIPIYEPGRRLVDTPRRLYPLLEQKTPGRGAGDTW
jgi:hypothetical protein